MAADATYTFRIVAEDRGCFENATGLADRVVLEMHDWVTVDTIDAFRRWDGGTSERPWDRLTDLEYPASLHGTFTEAANDELLYRKALKFIDALDELPHLAVIARDSDGRDEHAGFAAARARVPCDVDVVLAAMVPESEGWRVAAFIPRDTVEERRLDDVRKRLGFDPVVAPSRMSSTSGTDRDAKEVLKALTGGDEDRSRESLDESLERLRAVASESGLPAWLADFEAALARVVGRSPIAR